MTKTEAHTQELSLGELETVSGGHTKFHYVEMNGSTYAIGHINGRTVMEKVA